MNTISPALQANVDMGFTPEPFPAGTHMCYIFNDEDERRDVMVQYTTTGMTHDELVGYFADLSTDELVEDYLAQMGIPRPDAAHRDHTWFRCARHIYCPDNHFTPQGMLDRLKHLHNLCQDHHCSNLRVTGEMTWALSPEITGAENLVEYEARLNLLMETHPLTAICQYDANQFDGATLFEILQVHPMMVVRGQIVRNPYYVSAPNYLASRGLPI